MKKEFEFPFHRTIGGSEEQHQEIKKQWHESVGEIWDFKRKDISKYEQKITPEDQEIMEDVQTYVHEIALKYGGDPKILPKESMFVLRLDSLSEISNGEIENGCCNYFDRIIAVEWGSSKIRSAAILAHEMFHLESFSSLRMNQEKNKVLPYRMGISLHSKDKKRYIFKVLKRL
ncbi:MAG: hypothetical protein PHW24_01060 [Candidatus Moranbacteria bacterium]|nr:hypothetical protein [Candidatus Moranbacteria bacterium]